MDAKRFDAFTRMLGKALQRRAVIGGAAAAGLSAIMDHAAVEDTTAKNRKKKKKCKGGKKKCGKKCIPKASCCIDPDCGVNERCASGACESCLGQGTTCTDDAECCTGICDTYTNKCQQVRVSCENGEACPNGRCCDEFGKQCLYVTATQGECIPDGEPGVSCGYLLCGDACSDLSDSTYEFCGFKGSAACRNGRCCCPKGIPLEDCLSPSGVGVLLPRCP